MGHCTESLIYLYCLLWRKKSFLISVWFFCSNGTWSTHVIAYISSLGPTVHSVYMLFRIHHVYSFQNNLNLYIYLRPYIYIYIYVCIRIYVYIHTCIYAFVCMNHFLWGESFRVVNVQVARCTACCCNVLFQSCDWSPRASCFTGVSGPVLCTFVECQTKISIQRMWSSKTAGVCPIHS